MYASNQLLGSFLACFFCQQSGICFRSQPHENETHCHSREACLVIALSQQASHLVVAVVKVFQGNHFSRNILTSTGVIVQDTCQGGIESQCNCPHGIISKAITTVEIILSCGNLISIDVFKLCRCLVSSKRQNIICKFIVWNPTCFSPECTVKNEWSF